MNGLEPVNTVFGPFLRDPDEGLSRAMREAFATGTWCEVHGRIEPGPHYLACLECGHGFPTPEALVADAAAMAARLNADPLPPPWNPEWDGPTVANTDPQVITYCPHCSHDL